METIYIILIIVFIIILIVNNTKRSENSNKDSEVNLKPRTTEKKVDTASVIDDILIKNPKLNEAAKTGDINKINEALGDDIKLMSSILTDLAYSSQPAEKYRQKAIDFMYYPNEDFYKAIELLNKGLEYNDSETEPFIYENRAECYIGLKLYDIALNDFNKALELYNKDLPKNKKHIVNCLNDRARLRKKIGEIDGAKKDEELAKKLSEEY